LNRHPDARSSLTRRAFALDAFRRERLGPQATGLDAFLQFAEFEQQHADEAAGFLAQADEGEVIRFGKESVGAQQVRDLIFSRFTATEQPQHGHLQELLSAEASGPHAEEMRYLATLLEPWSAGGQTRNFATTAATAAAGAYVGVNNSHDKAKGAAIGAAAGFVVGETINYFSNKAQREAFLAGYEKGQSNAVKQQYWIARDNQRPRIDDGCEEAYYEITVPQTDRDGVRHEPTKRVIRVVMPKEVAGL